MTPRQIEILDVIWQCETLAQIKLFVASLPQLDQPMAMTLVEMVRLQALDDMINDHDYGFLEAHRMLTSIGISIQ